MSWRTVVISKTSKLDLKLGYMVVRDVESNIKIHISEISVLLVETTNCSITTALMSELIKNKIKVIFCDEKHNPSSELVSYYGCHDCSFKLRNQINWSATTKGTVWTRIVSEKIKNQAFNLKCFSCNEAELLFNYLDEIEFNDASNREGHAAKVYFNALFGKDFSRSSECPINAALNYGYSIILSCINREIVANGYLTQLGLFHDNMFNQFNLGCDLMEPFRPLVDRFVKDLSFIEFGVEEKRKIINLLNEDFIIDERKQKLLNTMKIYTKSVFDAIEADDISLIEFFAYEL